MVANVSLNLRDINTANFYKDLLTRNGMRVNTVEYGFNIELVIYESSFGAFLNRMKKLLKFDTFYSQFEVTGSFRTDIPFHIGTINKNGEFVYE